MAMIGRGIPARERSRRAARLLDEVGLGKRLDHLPGALSGGERQRVSIARSIANEPALLLADEPTGNLDTASAAIVMDLLFDLQRDRGMALLVVTHDEALAARCTRRIRLRDGRIVEDAGRLDQATAFASAARLAEDGR
jgi:putative ABC transport system ATP-binding protein